MRKNIGFFVFLIVSVTFLPSCITIKEKPPRYIFIDGGAYRGESFMKFKNTSLYTQYPWHIIAIEANPYILNQIPQGENITLLNKAIWTVDGTVTFYVGHAAPETSSLTKDKVAGDGRRSVIVESIDFGKWLKKNFKKNDHIIVSFDIEGAEFDVLEKMLEDKTIQYVDMLFVEFHDGSIKEKTKENREYLTDKIRSLGIIINNTSVDEGGHGILDNTTVDEGGNLKIG